MRKSLGICLLYYHLTTIHNNAYANCRHFHQSQSTAEFEPAARSVSNRERERERERVGS